MSQNLPNQKTCSKCEESRPLTSFNQYKTGRRAGTYQAECKLCRNARLRDYRKRNPARLRRIDRKARLRHRYGITEELPTQGICPICLRDKRLVVDHDHSTGLFRGLICYNCNTLLGHVENKEKFQRVLSYLGT